MKARYFTNGKEIVMCGVSEESITSALNDIGVSDYEFVDNDYIPNLSSDELALVAQSEMITELEWVDLQLKYHHTNDIRRAVSTIENLSKYAAACRDYVRNSDGVLTIFGERPARPE